MRPFSIQYFLSLLILVTLGSGCLVIENPYPKLAPGLWRGVLKVDDAQANRVGGSSDQQLEREYQFEEVTAGELPFEFEVIYDTPDSFHIVWINGSERIVSTDIAFGLDRRTAKDTLIVQFPLYDTKIEAVCESGVMQGNWIVNYKEDYRIPFVAKFGEGYRFTQLTKTPDQDLSGEWAVTFEPGTAAAYPGIAEFKQSGNDLTGTFRTETGDYRYLAGTVQANKLYLSCFDGAHAFLFEGKINENGTLIGSFRSGNHYQAYWEAKRDPDAQLANANEIPGTLDQKMPISLDLIDADGNPFSTNDEAYLGTPLLIQIMGTWCPNCMDETRFLQSYMKDNPSTDLAIISVAFEKYRDKDRVLPILQRYRDRMGIPWRMAWGGYANKEEAAKSLPFLNEVKAYPTLLFLDREHRIQRIHTGFDGPATSKYKQFGIDFHNFVNQLTGSSQ